MKFRIDTRPLWIVLLARWWRFPAYIALGWFLYHFAQVTPPEGLSVQAFRALLIFAVCLTLWVTHLLPLPVTGLFALITPPLLGVMPAKQAFAFFGTEPVFFILGVFILASALYRSGLSTRMALLLLRSAGSSPRRLIFQIMLTSALLSFIMSEHAVAAMMFPLIIVISRALEFKPGEGSYGGLLFLAMAWGCVIGGIATMLGGARVPLAIGMLEEAGHGTITFVQWTLAMLPLVVFLFIFCYFLLTRFLKIDVDSVAAADAAITQKVEQCGRMLLEEKFLGLLTIGAVFAWMFLGHQIGMASISILAVVLLFMFHVVGWEDLQEHVEWGVILMYGGAIAISSILNSTGAGLWLANTYVIPHLHSPWAMIMLLSFSTMIMTEAMSNSAVVAILLPIGMSVAGSFGLDPKVVVFAVASASGLAYALPMSTPSVAIAYSSGYLKIKEVLWPASILVVISWIALMLTAKLWWPVLGIVI